jgi:membrane protein implicated in regulation of membrane protease activity
MNWLKVGAIVVGGIIVFFVVDSLVHLFLGMLTAIVFVAIVAGGGYAAYKIAGARRRRRVKRRPEEPRVRQEQERRTIAVPPVTPAPAARHDVEDELARLKREMDR